MRARAYQGDYAGAYDGGPFWPWLAVLLAICTLLGGCAGWILRGLAR